MSNVDEGDPYLLLQGLQLDLERFPELGVERAERLVQQQNGRVEDQCPRERHPLLLAAGELVRFAVAELLHLHGGAPLRPCYELLPGHLREAQPKGDVLDDRQVGEEGVALEHGVDVAPVRGVSDTSLPSSKTRPPLGRSKPAIRRKVVVLPHPLGPSSEKNSPGGMSRSMPQTASNPPNRLARSATRTWRVLAAFTCVTPARPRSCPQAPRSLVLLSVHALFSPRWQEDAAVVLEEPVRLAETVVELQEVPVVADLAAGERYGPLGPERQRVGGEVVLLDDVPPRRS